MAWGKDFVGNQIGLNKFKSGLKREELWSSYFSLDNLKYLVIVTFCDITGKHCVLVYEGGNSMIRFPLTIADSKGDMPGNEPGPIGCHSRALTTELKEVRHLILQKQ